MRHVKLRTLCAMLLGLLSLSSDLWGRLRGSEGAEDLPRLSDNATFIFQADVLSINEVDGRIAFPNRIVHDAYIADLKINRWYKSSADSERIRLRYSAYASDGHDCIDLKRTSTWLIFATQAADGVYEFSDDVDGVLPVSPILTSEPNGTWMERLQQDLIAGLQDANPDRRLANIARLGALEMPTSGNALREFAENGSEREKLWAIYAALRSKDPGIFPRVESMVLKPIRSDDSEPNWLWKATAAPQCSMYMLELRIRDEVGNLRSPDAIPMLAGITRSASEKNMRKSALYAIQRMYDPRALDALVHLLSDPDPNLKSAALDGIRSITSEPECQMDEGEEASIESCKTWWEEEGSETDWSPLLPENRLKTY